LGRVAENCRLHERLSEWLADNGGTHPQNNHTNHCIHARLGLFAAWAVRHFRQIVDDVFAGIAERAIRELRIELTVSERVCGTRDTLIVRNRKKDMTVPGALGTISRSQAGLYPRTSAR
jgi:hypothetical protein